MFVTNKSVAQIFKKEPLYGGFENRIFENVVSADICNKIVALCEKREAFPEKRELKIDDNLINAIYKIHNKTNGITHFYIKGAVRDMLYEKISKTLGIQKFNIDLKIRKYLNAETIWHYDTSRDAFANGILYLNDLVDSGHTVYREEENKTEILRIRPKSGKLTIHTNLDNDGYTINTIKHKSEFTEKEKWIAIIYFRFSDVKKEASEFERDLVLYG